MNAIESVHSNVNERERERERERCNQTRKIDRKSSNEKSERGKH